MTKTHDCLKEADLAEIKVKLRHLDKVIDGNGQEGLSSITIRLVESVKVLNDSVNLLKTSVSGFVRFQTEYQVMCEATTKHALNKRWMWRTIIALFSLLITSLALLFKIK